MSFPDASLSVFLSDASVSNGLQVNGNIGVVGNVRLDGMFYVGDDPVDTVVIAPDFTPEALVSMIKAQSNGDFTPVAL